MDQSTTGHLQNYIVIYLPHDGKVLKCLERQCIRHYWRLDWEKRRKWEESQIPIWEYRKLGNEQKIDC